MSAIEQDIKKFSPMFPEIVAFARRIQFDIVNGDVKDLVRLWISSNVAFYNQTEQEQINLIKNLIDKSV